MKFSFVFDVANELSGVFRNPIFPPSRFVERETKSLASVKKLNQQYPTLRDIHTFLFTQHDLYAVKGLLKDAEKIDEKTLESYDAKELPKLNSSTK